MKRKVLSILLTLIMVLSVCLATALPTLAATSPRETAVVAAADRLVELQNTDGGFCWLAPATGTSYTNVLGVSAMGIIKAWNIEAKPAYNTALANAYKYVMDTPPAYVWNGTKYTENPKGVDSDPDITFLVALASAAADPDLLAAINSAVPGTAAADILTLAKDRWDNRNAFLGSTQETPLNGDAAGYAAWERDLRHGTDGYWDSLIPWNLGLAVEAVLALNDAYPGEGYDQQAADITNVIYASIDDSLDGGACLYFSSTDTTQEDYIAGLTGAVYAASATATNQAKAADLLTLLLAQQLPNGSWPYYGEDPSDTAEVQDTAYAVTALFAQGGSTSIVSANKAADWLVSTQLPTGGWYSDGGDGSVNTSEYAEVDSEAAWALATAAGASSVDMTASYTYIPPATKIGISVDPTTVNFGSLTPAVASTGHIVNVTNTGNVAEDFAASLANISTPDVYTTGLKLSGSSVSAWTVLNVAVAEWSPTELVLIIPTATAPGTYTATLVFWAEASD